MKFLENFSNAMTSFKKDLTENSVCHFVHCSVQKNAVHTSVPPSKSENPLKLAPIASTIKKISFNLFQLVFSPNFGY